MLRVVLIICLLSVTCFCQPTPAPAKATEPTWTWMGDAALIIRVDLRSEQMKQTLSMSKESVASNPLFGIAGRTFGRQLLNKARRLAAAGADEVCAGIHLGSDDAPLIVVGYGPNADVNTIREVLLPADERELRYEDLRDVPGAVLVGSKSRIASTKNAKPANEAHLAEAFASVADCPFQCVALASDTARKQVLEGLPMSLGPDLGGGDVGTMVASVSWVAAGLNAPDMNLRLIVTTTDAAAAEKLSTLFQRIRPTLQAMLEEPAPEAADLIREIRIVQKNQALTIAMDARQVEQAMNALPLSAKRMGLKRIFLPRMERVAKAIREFTANNNGQFPRNLAELVNKGSLERDALFNPLMMTEQVGYAYVPPNNAADAIAAKRLVAYQKFDDWDAGVPVALADGSVRLVSRLAEFERMLKEASDNRRK